MAYELRKNINLNRKQECKQNMVLRIIVYYTQYVQNTMDEANTKTNNTSLAPHMFLNCWFKNGKFGEMMPNSSQSASYRG